MSDIDKIASLEKAKYISKQSYSQNPETKKYQSKQSYSENPEPKKYQSKQSYAQDPNTKKERTKEYYQENAEAIKQKQKDRYNKRTEAQKERHKQRAKEYRDLKKEQKKNKKVDSSKCPGYFDRDNFDETKYRENYLGPMNAKCRHCGSMNFAGEMIKDKDGGHFSICCHNGKVKLQIPKWPKELKDLYTGKGTPNEPRPVFVEPEEKNQKRNLVPFYDSSKEFLNNIRTYNNSFSFASTSITIPPQFRNLKPNAATTFVKVQGIKSDYKHKLNCCLILFILKAKYYIEQVCFITITRTLKSALVSCIRLTTRKQMHFDLVSSSILLPTKR